MLPLEVENVLPKQVDIGPIQRRRLSLLALRPLCRLSKGFPHAASPGRRHVTSLVQFVLPLQVHVMPSLVPHFQVTSILGVDFVLPLEVAIMPPIVMCLVSRSPFICRPGGSFTSLLFQHHTASRGCHYVASLYTGTGPMAHAMARTSWLLVHIQPQILQETRSTLTS